MAFSPDFFDFFKIEEYEEDTLCSPLPLIKEAGILLLEYFKRDEHAKANGFLQILDEKEGLAFFQALRVSRECFEHLLEVLEFEEQGADEHTGGRSALSNKTTLFLGLWYLANTSSFREISELFGFCQATVHVSTWKIINSLVALTPTVIKWPTADQMDETASAFEENSGFPGVLGAIDGCHISITAPKDVQADYLDRTMKHSMLLMAVCDSKRRYTFVHCGFPGSAHDQRVLSLTPLWEHVKSSEDSEFFPSNYYHIVGDSAFSLVEHLMVPYKDNGNLTVKQIKFNKKLSQARHIVENSFAWLKGRFRRLHMVNTQLERIPSIIQACCVLHNIALDFPDYEIVGQNDGQVVPTEFYDLALPTSKGKQKRDKIMNSF